MVGPCGSLTWVFWVQCPVQACVIYNLDTRREQRKPPKASFQGKSKAPEECPAEIVAPLSAKMRPVVDSLGFLLLLVLYSVCSVYLMAWRLGFSTPFKGQW